MASLPLTRFAQVESRLVTSQDRAGFDWVGPMGTPKEMALIRVQATQNRIGALVPIAYVTPIVFVVGAEGYLPIAHNQFSIMDGLRVLVNRSEIDQSDVIRVNSPPGQLNWGLAVHLIRGCTQAQITYWQWA